MCRKGGGVEKMTWGGNDLTRRRVSGGTGVEEKYVTIYSMNIVA